MLALMLIGVTAINVTERYDPESIFADKQILFASVGIIAFVVATVLPYQKIGRWAYPLFAATLVVLLILAGAKVFHHSSILLPAIRGSHRWINLGFINFQPSELAKLTYIILLAWYFRYGSHYRKLSGLVVPLVLTFVPMCLILIEPDLGTSLLFLPTLYFMLFMAGAKLKHLLGIVTIATVLIFIPVPRKVPQTWSAEEVEDRALLAYGGRAFEVGQDKYLVSAAPLSLMAHHQIQRVEGWFAVLGLLGNDDETAELTKKIAMNEGYQLNRSMMILGAGGLAGNTLGKEAEPFFGIPDDHTDFIFAVIAGHWGFLGCLAVLFLYAVIFVFGIEIAAITNDAFGRLLAVGVLTLLFSQLFINVGMTMGLMPITGMTMPFISYGGSSLVINCAALGLLVNVGQRRPILLGRRPFEYGQKKEKPPAPYGPLAK